MTIQIISAIYKLPSDAAYFNRRSRWAYKGPFIGALFIFSNMRYLDWINTAIEGIGMERYAVFVDAGYLYKSGCKLLGHDGAPRQHMTLNPQAFVQTLDSHLAGKVNGSLLRVYWYDGLPQSGTMSSDQSKIAFTDNFKLRLGQINGFGQQKGVDSMIITDMIELARNGAIGDALLIGGDDDLRIGVQVTQTFGVRVHLLGLGSDPSQASMSRYLRQEADSTAAWDQLTVTTFLTVAASAPPTLAATAGITAVTSASPSIAQSAIENAVDTFVTQLDSNRLSSVAQHQSGTGDKSIPSDLDRELLKVARQAIGAPLDTQQKRDMRRYFNTKVNSLPRGGQTP
ncbi:NYN domain-containing protein [Niveispirillum irakense]|uniref:NYN domain-containing protein n=1 Tax=Niveispirillum irakense TaxID=34011 RepID=UPI000686E69A|nr:NYN domain-containing protein [Niveispirillum irakense]